MILLFDIPSHITPKEISNTINTIHALPHVNTVATIHYEKASYKNKNSIYYLEDLLSTTGMRYLIRTLKIVSNDIITDNDIFRLGILVGKLLKSN